VGVGGVQHPAEVHARSPVDHRLDQPLAEAVAPGLADHEDVGQVGEDDAVRQGAGEADQLARCRLVGADHPPGGRELSLEIGAGALLAPVGLRGQEVPDRVHVDPARVVV
jgi:hypothetical protein